MIIEYVVNVSIYDDNADGPNAAIIGLGPALIRRIKVLARTAKKLKVWQIKDFDYTPEFKYLMDNELKDDETSIDTACLEVTERCFAWGGYIKHTSIALSTDEISLKEINENQKVLKSKIKVLPLLMTKGKLKYESSRLILNERIKGGDLPATLRVNVGVDLED